MTVAVSCSLADGVILGVDSAVTISDPRGILKVYENAEKVLLSYRHMSSHHIHVNSRQISSAL